MNPHSRNLTFKTFGQIRFVEFSLDYLLFTIEFIVNNILVKKIVKKLKSSKKA